MGPSLPGTETLGWGPDIGPEHLAPQEVPLQLSYPSNFYLPHVDVEIAFPKSLPLLPLSVWLLL